MAERAGGGHGAPPLIVTLLFDGATFAYLDGLRRRHFPPERNVVPAHLSLFHALPGEEAPRVIADLAAACARQRAFDVVFPGVRSLGRGVALTASSPSLEALHRDLAREWRDWLTPQDSARLAPHVTIQNKVPPEAARTLLSEMRTGFSPFTARAEGLMLWRYLGGPWHLVRRFPFTGR